MSIIGLRDARNEVDRAELHRLLDELLDLRERSDPKNGNDPATLHFRDLTGKNAAAEVAVHIGNYLLLASAGWAVNHIVGRVLPDDGSHGIDSHEHELAGSAEASGFTGTTRESSRALVERAVIRALLDSSIFPFSLSSNLKAAMRALDFGEVWPIVKPENKGLHGSAFTLAQYKIIAIEYVSFLVGQGIKKTTAEHRVATLFGISVHTLKSWASRDLLTFFNKERIAEISDSAKAAGKLLVVKKDDPDYAKPAKGRSEAIPFDVYYLWEKFKDNSINEMAAEYKKALRNSGN